MVTLHWTEEEPFLPTNNGSGWKSGSQGKRWVARSKKVDIGFVKKMAPNEWAVSFRLTTPEPFAARRRYETLIEAKAKFNELWRQWLKEAGLS